MKNAIILAFAIFIGIYPCVGFSQTLENREVTAIPNNDWQTFRSEDAHFRFIYPPSWVSKTPRGENVKALVSGGEGGSNCNVVVKPLPRGYSESDFWGEAAPEDMTPPNSSLLNSGATYLNNKKAMMAVYDTAYKAMDIAVDLRFLMIMAVENNAMYAITCGGQADTFEASQETFNSIIRSFVFETWTDPSNSPVNNEDMSTNDLIFDAVDTGEYGLLSMFLAFSFALTWGIGLTPPLLIRYAFYRRPLNKWPAIGYCALLFCVNIVIFTALGSESKTHSALVIIAFVSYYILKNGQRAHPFQTNSVNESDTKDSDSSSPIKPGKEVAITIAALEDLRPEYDSADVFYSSAVDEVFKQAKKIIRADKKDVVDGIVKNGRNPAEIALTALWNVSNQAVSSGHYHVYRGILSDQGKGYLYVYTKTVDVLLEKGFIDKNEAENNRKSIQENIKSVG